MVRRQITIDQVFPTSPTKGITTSRELQSFSESSPSVSFPSGPWKQDRWDSKALGNLEVGNRLFLLILCHLTFSSQFQPDEWKRFWTISLETCLTIKLEGVYYLSIVTFIYCHLLSTYLNSIIVLTILRASTIFLLLLPASLCSSSSWLSSSESI